MIQPDHVCHQSFNRYINTRENQLVLKDVRESIEGFYVSREGRKFRPREIIEN